MTGRESTPSRIQLRPYQTEAIARLQHRVEAGARRVLLVSPTGAGKCVTRETLVWSGGLRRFGDLWGSEHILGPLGRAAVSGWYDDGRREGLELALGCGITIDGTHEHRVWVRTDDGFEGWRELGKLSGDEWIAVARGRADFGSTEVPLDEAYALGLLIADGCCIDGRMQIDKQRPVLTAVRGVVRRWLIWAEQPSARITIRDASPRHAVLLAEAELRPVFLSRYGIEWQYSENRVVPPAVLKGTREVVRAFLRGYFDGDGDCFRNPSVSTSSPRLAEEVQQLLLGLGVFASRRKRETDGLPSHVVDVHDTEAFAREVGFSSYGLTKDRRFHELLERRRNTNVDVVPGLGGLLRRAAQLVPSRTQRRDSWRHVDAYYRDRRPNYDLLGRLLDAPDALPRGTERDELERIVAEHLAWSPIAQISASTRRRIDCEVLGQHAFVGNGIINHNTVLAGSIIASTVQEGQRVLFLAHRRELINQAYRKLLDFGLTANSVGVVMASDARRRPGAPVQVASVDTLRHRARPAADLVFVDECFPAGTLVDDRPIESVREGDLVSAFNHQTGEVERRRVLHCFVSTPSALVTIHFASGAELTCTPGHPVFCDRGYVPAAQLQPGDVAYRRTDAHQTEDMRCVRDQVRPEVVELQDGSDLFCQVSRSAARCETEGGDSALQGMRGNGDAPGSPGSRPSKSRGCLLLPRLQTGLDEKKVRGGDGRDKPTDRLCSHEGEQSDVEARGPKEALEYPTQDEVAPPCSWREWARPNASTATSRRSAGARDGGRGANEDATRQRVSHVLQVGSRRPRAEAWHRSGWPQPLCTSEAGAGREEGCLPCESRVDRVEVHQRCGNGFGELCPDGRVYNLEVEGHHNYFANGFLVHNCHRALARTYRSIAADFPRAIHIGLTATPYRADGKGLGDAYDELLVVASPRQLIQEGFLVEPRVFTIPESERPDLSQIRIARGDFAVGELESAVDRQRLVGNIVEHWFEHARGIRTVVFAVSVAHSKHIVERFCDAGVPAEHLDGTTPMADRDAILRRLDAGTTLVVGSVNCLAEGWDQPSAKCAILARPTKSTGLYLQQAGRILRPWQGQQAIILDHGGCALEHGLPQDDREFSLEGRKKQSRSKGSAPVRECPTCLAVLGIGTRVCPECGTELIADRELPEEEKGVLVEVTSVRAATRVPAGSRHTEPATARDTARSRHQERAVVDALRSAARSKGIFSWAAIDMARSDAP